MLPQSLLLRLNAFDIAFYFSDLISYGISYDSEYVKPCKYSIVLDAPERQIGLRSINLACAFGVRHEKALDVRSRCYNSTGALNLEISNLLKPPPILYASHSCRSLRSYPGLRS